MTMPHLMNCGHSDTGWCLDCVKAQWEELDNLKMRNEAWHRRVEQLNLDLEELDKLREQVDKLTADRIPFAETYAAPVIAMKESAEIRLKRALEENADLNHSIDSALALVNKECPAMDAFVNIVPTVQWLLQKWRECRQRWQDAVVEQTRLNDYYSDEAIKLRRSQDALAVAVEALKWYSTPRQPEASLSDNGDRATAALIVIMEKLK